MSLFSALVKTSINIAIAPIDILKNIAEGNEEPIQDVLDKIKKESEG